MQTENTGNTSPNSAFKSKVNPEPDPHDMTISTLKYESDVKAHKAIEKLASVSHDAWQYWSMSIMRDLDELITLIIELDRIVSALDTENYPNSSYHLSATNLIKKHNERNARWQKQWVAYKHLPEEVKETDRIWAKKAYTTMKENPK
jgi:hypothetical protein